jgi:hypothetical protein
MIDLQMSLIFSGAFQLVFRGAHVTRASAKESASLLNQQEFLLKQSVPFNI